MIMIIYQCPWAFTSIPSSVHIGAVGKEKTDCLGAVKLESKEPSFVKKLISSIYLGASKVE